MRKRIEATLERFGVNFDTWSSERALHESNALEATLGELAEGGHTYESDGALWLRTSDWGDDKDRVLIRSDGEPTYFAADIAYHRDKLSRGAEQMIVPLGADHHGYVPRMQAAVGMLSGDPDRYEAPIMQFVNIIEGGARARMSKRKGDFVTLDELIEDIGRDAARFFLLQRSHDTVIDLDLELARSQSQENPVYYVQYAHARIAGIIRNAQKDPIGDAAVPCEPAERAAHPSLARVSRRGADCGAKGVRPIACALMRQRSRPTFTPSTATAAWSALTRRQASRDSSRLALECASPLARSSPRAWICSASARRTRCDQTRSRHDE